MPGRTKRRWGGSTSASPAMGAKVARLRLRALERRQTQRTQSSQSSERVSESETHSSVVKDDENPWTCTICWDELGGAIYQCPEGHLLCGSCSGNVKLTRCGVCRSPLGQRIRARAVEEFLSNVVLRCRFGCGFRGVKTVRAAHEATCLKAPAGCAFCGFTFRGDVPAIIDHVRSAHAALDITSKSAVALHGTTNGVWCLPLAGATSVFGLFVARTETSCYVNVKRLLADQQQAAVQLKLRVQLPDSQAVSLNIVPSDAPDWSLKRLRREFRRANAAGRTFRFPASLLDDRDDIHISVATDHRPRNPPLSTTRDRRRSSRGPSDIVAQARAAIEEYMMARSPTWGPSSRRDDDQQDFRNHDDHRNYWGGDDDDYRRRGDDPYRDDTYPYHDDTYRDDFGLNPYRDRRDHQFHHLNDDDYRDILDDHHDDDHRPDHYDDHYDDVPYHTGYT